MNDLLALLPTFGLSLGLTLVLEGVLALLWRVRGRDLGLFVLVNLLTNPAVVYLHLLFSTLFFGVPVLTWQLPLECAVVAVEGGLYARLGHAVRRPRLFALLANGVSYSAGLILGFLI